MPRSHREMCAIRYARTEVGGGEAVRAPDVTFVLVQVAVGGAGKLGAAVLANTWAESAVAECAVLHRKP